MDEWRTNLKIETEGRRDRDERRESDNSPKVLRMHTNYMSRAFGDIENIRDNMVEATKGLKYDTLVGTGLSGSLVVPSLAREMGLHWAIVRKSDGSHSNNRIEGEIGQRWLFVDDVVASGQTKQRVRDVVEEVTTDMRHHTEYVGTYMYEYNEVY